MKKAFFFAWIALFTGFQTLSFSRAEENVRQSPQEEQNQPIQKKQQCDPQKELRIPSVIF